MNWKKKLEDRRKARAREQGRIIVDDVSTEDLEEFRQYFEEQVFATFGIPPGVILTTSTPMNRSTFYDHYITNTTTGTLYDNTQTIQG